MNPLIDLIASALLWAVFATLVSQVASIGVMWALGLPPRKLVREIEDVQNAAVGACFFIISLITALFMALMSSSGFTPDPSALEGILWMAGGLAVSFIFMFLSFMIAHRVMGRENDETVYGYIRREIVAEQNASLAFFLGGLAVAPFISVMFQLI